MKSEDIYKTTDYNISLSVLISEPKQVHSKGMSWYIPSKKRRTLEIRERLTTKEAQYE